MSMWSRRKKEVVPKKCEYCLSIMQRHVYPSGGFESTIDYAKRRFCNNQCSFKAHSKYTPIEGRCCAYKKCNNILIRHNYNGRLERIEKFNLRKYCSPSCWHLASTKRIYRKWNPNCWHCRNPLVRKKTERLTNWHQRKFCDRECFNLYKFDHELHVQSALKEFPCTRCDVDSKKLLRESYNLYQ